MLVGFFLAALMGCSETHNYYFTGCGEGGVLHSGDYGVACSYVVVVTGFECPSEVPYHSEFDGGHVCSSEPIDPAELPREICNAFKGKCEPVSPVDSGMPPDASVGCNVTADCAEGQYCKGDCSALGTCTAIPKDATCTEAEVEYCLCDGTPAYHPNGCVWERYTPGDNSCRNTGTECMETADCMEGFYCDGDCSAPGTCTPIPDVDCGEAETPYCTCDGDAAINSNTCVWERHNPGDNSCRNTSGECQQTEDCAQGYYCNGNDCSTPGTCTKIPDDAVCTDDLARICLCDGSVVETSSTCVWDRHQPGDNRCMNTSGECQQTEDCAEGYYCKGDCSGPGMCAIIPEEACPPSAPFYCACDGEVRQSTSACIYDRHDPEKVDTEECGGV